MEADGWLKVDDNTRRGAHVLVRNGVRIAALVWHGDFVERPDYWMAIYADKRESNLFSDILSEAKQSVESACSEPLDG